MQVDPIKSTLKPPGTKRRKLNCDEPLSNVAFNLNLRRYNEGRENFLEQATALASKAASTAVSAVSSIFGGAMAGRCRLTLSNPS